MTVVVKTGGWRFLMKASTKMNKRKAVPPGVRVKDEKHWLSGRNNGAEKKRLKDREPRAANWESCAEVEIERKGWVMIEDLMAVFGTFIVEEASKNPSERKLRLKWAETRPQTFVCHCIFTQLCVSNFISNLILFASCRLLCIELFYSRL